MEIIIDNWLKIEWDHIGEGYNGDYNPNDPEDCPLYRFYVSTIVTSEFEEYWEQVDSASYCTQVTDDVSSFELMGGLFIIAVAIFKPLQEGESIKKICEKLSWLSNKDLI